VVCLASRGTTPRLRKSPHPSLTARTYISDIRELPKPIVASPYRNTILPRWSFGARRCGRPLIFLSIVWEVLLLKRCDISHPSSGIVYDTIIMATSNREESGTTSHLHGVYESTFRRSILGTPHRGRGTQFSFRTLRSSGRHYFPDQ